MLPRGRKFPLDVIERQVLAALRAVALSRAAKAATQHPSFAQVRFIKRVLERKAGNRSLAAQALGIHRNSLARKIEEFRLNDGNARPPRKK
jgi:transcriptional regulator with PAS, ATPase and Fis domain